MEELVTRFASYTCCADRFTASYQVCELVQRGANVNAVNKDGNTPLHLAAHSGDREMVRAFGRGRVPIERTA